MNYCPHCGKPLRSCEFSPCERSMEKPFTGIDNTAVKSSAAGKKKMRKKDRRNLEPHTRGQEQIVMNSMREDGYDGYYDDVRPEDENKVRQDIDRDIIRRIAGLVAGVMIIICCCIAFMYLI